MDPGDVVVIAARLGDVVGDERGLKVLPSCSRMSWSKVGKGPC
jgi:hypothetical protein